MSIKAKLTIGISSIALVILIINSMMFYDYARLEVKKNRSGNMRQVTNEMTEVTTPDDISVHQDEPLLEAETLRHLMLRQSILSLVILSAVAAVAYLMSGFIIRPLALILNKVNQIAIGVFGEPIQVRRRDEFGLLASHTNRMSANMESHTKKLQQAVEELRSTKEYLESFVGQTSDAIHVVNLQGKLLMMNNAFESVYGWSREELDRQVVSIVPGAQTEEAQKLIHRLMQGGQVSGLETIGWRADGESIEVSVTISPIRDSTGQIVAFATITRDITDRRQTEELLRRSEKLSIVGQLAAGVAHEIRNPLTTLRGFVQLEQQSGRSNPRHLGLMLSELDRINFIVSEFLILAKPQASHFEQKDLRLAMREIVSLLESQANMSNIEFRTSLADDVPSIRCEVNQLKQVFVNLLKNGMEAMPDGGFIDISVQLHSPGEVLIRISDYGCGIPQDRLEKLGEPFYTSKENGTGLGLMVCHRIIANHKGTMHISSTVGEGTTVDITLPIT